MVYADALDLHVLSIQEEALITVKADGADAEGDTFLLLTCLASVEELGTIQAGGLGRPQGRRRHFHLQSLLPAGAGNGLSGC